MLLDVEILCMLIADLITFNDIGLGNITFKNSKIHLAAHVSLSVLLSMKGFAISFFEIIFLIWILGSLNLESKVEYFVFLFLNLDKFFSFCKMDKICFELSLWLSLFLVLFDLCCSSLSRFLVFKIAYSLSLSLNSVINGVFRLILWLILSIVCV